MKMNNCFAFVIMVLLFCLSCKVQDEREVFFEKFPNSKKIQGKAIQLEGFLGNPLGILTKDSLLIVNEFRSDFLIHIYNISNGKILRREGVVGRGPNEFSPPLDISFSLNGDSLQIFERQRFVYNEYILDDSLRLSTAGEPKAFNSSNQRMYKLSEKVFLGIGIYSDGRFGLFDIETNNISYLSDFPEAEFSGTVNGKAIPNDVKAMIFQGTLRIRQDKKRFVMANQASGILEIYAINSANLEKIAEQRINYTIDLQNFSSGNVLRVDLLDSNHGGYKDLYISNNYIYALYSGRTRKEFPGTSHMGTFILVFDWDGNPIMRYEMDKPVSCFTINIKKQKLYGICEEGDPTLLEFDIRPAQF